MVSPLRRLGRTGLIEHRTKPPSDPEPTSPNSGPRKKYATLLAKHSKQFTPATETKERYNPFSVGARNNKKWTTPTGSVMTPAGTSVVSPSSSEKLSSPLGSTPREPFVSPGRRRLFERRTTPSSTSEMSEDTPTSRDQAELLQLREKNTRTESQLRVLHERFHHIQKGLGNIDQERVSLVEKAERLEEEKKAIQRQLELRDKEILSLVKRCASQEERMRESSQLRALNRELTTRLDSAKKKSRKQRHEEESFMALRKQLQESELAREDLQDRLAKVQREHDTIADTLQECLANVRRLTEEKREIEEERRREKKRSQIELEKQRLQHLEIANSLKDDIGLKESKISQMEHILQENMLSNTSLRRENALLSGDQASELKEIVDKYENELSALKQQVQDTAREKDEEYEKKLKKLKLEIQDMEAVMRELESEFSRQMQDLMVKQSSLDEAEEEKKALEHQIESIGKVEHEHSALLDIVDIMDSNLADLTTENAQLTLEKDSLLEEVEEMKRKTDELQNQLKRIQGQRKAREDDFRDLLQAEKQEYAEDLESALNVAKAEVEALKVELASRNKWILKLEEEIRDARRSVIQKEEAIHEMRREHDLMISSLRLSLTDAEEDRRKLEQELAERDRCLASTEGMLNTARCFQDRDKKRIKRLEDEQNQLLLRRSELSRATTGSEESKSASDSREEAPMGEQSPGTRETRDPVDSANQIEVKQTRLELESLLAVAKDSERTLQEEISLLHKDCKALQGQISSKNGVIEEREETIKTLEQSLVQNKERCKELEEELKDVTSELERYEGQIRLLQRTNSSLEIEAEYGRKSLDAEQLNEQTTDTLRKEVERFRQENEEMNDRCRQLQQELTQRKEILSDRETRIVKFENDHQHLSESKSFVEDALADANKKIEELHSRLEEKNVVFLENELKAAHKELSKQEMKAMTVEMEYSETVKLQSQRENYNREACTRIASLEDQLSECKSRLTTLDQKLKDSNKNLEAREQRVQELEQQEAEFETRASMLEKSAEEKGKALESIKNTLRQKENHWSALEKAKLADQQKIQDLQTRIESMEAAIEEKEAKRDSLVEQLSEEVKKVSEIQSEKDSLNKKCDSLNLQLRDAHKTLDNMERRLQEADSKSAEKSLEYSKLQAEKEKVESEKARLQEQQSESEKKITSLKEKIASMAESSTFLATELSETSANLEQAIEDHKTKESQWEQHKESFQKEKSSILEQLSGRDESIKVLEGDLNTEKERFGAMEKSMVELEDAKESLAAKEKALTARCQSLEEELAESQRKIQELDSGWQKQLDAKQATLEEAESKVAGLETDKEAMMTRIEEATEEIALLDEELGKKNQKIDGLEREIEKLDKSDIEESFVESEKCRLAAENKLCDTREEIKSLKGKLEQRESRLLKVDLHLETVTSSIKEKDAQLAQAVQKGKELEAKLEDLNGLVESREGRLLKVDEELHTALRRIEQKDSEVQSLESLKTVLQSSLDKAHGEVSSLAELSESRRQRLSALDEELLTARQSLMAKESKIASLDKELSSEKESNQKLREENSDLQKELSEEKTSRVANLKEIADQKSQISSLESDLKETAQDLESEQKSREKEGDELGKTIKKLETTVALKDDEIRDLRLVELKDAEEAIETLTGENASVKKELEDLRASSTQQVSDLEADKNHWMQRAGEAAEMADLASEEYEKTIELYRDQTQELKASNQELCNKISEQDDKLKERHGTIMSLTQNQKSLEEEQSNLQCENEKLKKSESKAIEEIEKLNMALDVGIRREREEAEIKLRESEMAHRKELGATQSRLRETSVKLEESQRIIEERSNLLSDMVEHNKQLESKLEKQQVELKTVKEERVKTRKEFDATKQQLSMARNKLRDTEKSLTTKLDSELNRRQSAEKKLAKMKVQVEEAMKSKKQLADMEKENEQLKDKISRQEAYLQRKLQKEKQSRAATTTPKKAANTTPKKGVPLSHLRTPKRRPLGAKSILVAPSTSGSVNSQSSGLRDLALEVE